MLRVLSLFCLCAEKLKGELCCLFKIRLVLSSFFSQVMFEILFKELLKESIYENNFIHETLATYLEVWNIVCIKYHGIHCNLKKSFCDRWSLGWFTLKEPWPNKPHKQMAKNLVMFHCMCAWGQGTASTKKSWRNLSVAHEMLAYNIFRYCSFFYNRQFILPSEKSITCRRKRDWLCIVFGFSLINFEFLSLFVLRWVF